VTGSYNLLIKRSAEKELKKLPEADLRRIIDRIRHLAQHPFPAGCEKLSGDIEPYRIRQGDYRMVYGIDDAACLVEIVKIGHRREVYRS
jgi:mRNA interferase RelE/StbE